MPGRPALDGRRFGAHRSQVAKDAGEHEAVCRGDAKHRNGLGIRAPHHGTGPARSPGKGLLAERELHVGDLKGSVSLDEAHAIGRLHVGIGQHRHSEL